MELNIKLSKKELAKLKKDGNVVIKCDLLRLEKEKKKFCEIWTIKQTQHDYELHKCGKYHSHAGSREEALRWWTKEGIPAWVINDCFDQFEPRRCSSCCYTICCP